MKSVILARTQFFFLCLFYGFQHAFAVVICGNRTMDFLSRLTFYQLLYMCANSRMRYRLVVSDWCFCGFVCWLRHVILSFRFLSRWVACLSQLSALSHPHYLSVLTF